VASALAKATGSTPLRYSDSNRYLTAATVAERTIGVPGRTAWDGTAFVATGGNFPDALAAAPVAAKMGWPLYLADPAGMQGSLVTRMKAAGVKKVIVLGGTSAVSAATMNQLTAAGMPATRWSGSDRYDTARVVATNSLGAYSGLTVGKLALATGENFPDALAGGVMQGLSGSVMLLSNGQTLSAPTAEMLSANKGKVSELRFLGGTSVLSTAVRQAALARVNP
jgi:putative cell wall-binding protein